MFNKKIISTFLEALCFITLSSWNLSSVSRQKATPNYEENFQKMRDLKRQEKELKKQQREVKRDHYQFAYLAHQKNRLASFADHDGFIWFSGKENKYTYFLSNFYPAKLKIWNMKFGCAEAAFQAAKFLHKPDVAARFTHLDGEEAWKLAQKMSYQQRGDWYQVREGIMADVVRAKFQQYPDLKELLLATGDAYLVEHTSRDAFWADGGDGKGKNRLGYLLMQVRAENGGIGPVSKPSKYRSFVK
jgi:ribA/ribD-fused uncharacterized protein